MRSSEELFKSMNKQQKIVSSIAAYIGLLVKRGQKLKTEQQVDIIVCIVHFAVATIGATILYDIVKGEPEEDLKPALLLTSLAFREKAQEFQAKLGNLMEMLDD